jgi:hypothetical protein
VSPVREGRPGGANLGERDRRSLNARFGSPDRHPRIRWRRHRQLRDLDGDVAYLFARRESRRLRRGECVNSSANHVLTGMRIFKKNRVVV